MDKDISIIPEGIYCYDSNGICPYWSRNKSQPKQLNGYCSFLELGDWMDRGTFLLWDQVKECGINNEIDFDKE